MKKRITKKYHEKKLFTSPGSLIYVGKEVAQSTVLELVEYNQDFLREKIIKVVSECKVETDDKHVAWLDVDGIHEPAVVEAIGKHYHLHPLLLEDVLNSEQKADRKSVV